MNPAGCDPWGLDSFQLFPNFTILIWGQGWYLTYHYWPTSYNSHIFEGTLYFVPAKTPRERIAHELAAVSFKEFGLQDANTLEATQSMLESRVVDRFPLGDQEVLCRHLHKETAKWVDDYQQQRGGAVTVVTALLPQEFADLEPFAADWCLPTERERFDKRLASSMADMQAFYDAITPRAEAAMTYLDQYTLDDLPPEALNLMHLLYSMIMVSFPVECWHQPRIPDSGVADLDLVVEPVP